MKPLGKVKQTSRGFEVVRFKDLYGAECSLQQSSLADRAAVWFGPNEANPQMLHGYAIAHGVTDPGAGWVPFPMPEYVHCTTRAHLDRKQVAKLVAHLQAWLDTGSLKIKST